MNMKILVVDDEREIAEHIASLVMRTESDSFVEVYSSGTKALNTLKKRYFDMVITDMVMPVTDGFAILNYIAQNSPSTEVIILSAYRTFDYIYKANRIKRISYIVKTEDDETICHTITEILDRIRVYQKERMLILQTLGNESNQFDINRTTDVVQEEIEIISRIKEYITSYINRDISVSTIANKFHYSASYISRVFKYHTNENLSVYIMKEKIAEAKRLLTTTDIPIQTISLNLGYQSPQAFARAFKRETGLSPQEFRHRLNK